MSSVRQTLDAALQHYRQGDWQQAEQLYLRALAAAPGQVDALHLLALGSACAAQGKLAVALASFLYRRKIFLRV